MEAIILAGGLGSRLKKVVPDLPKPMAPVVGRPFLEILLTFLASQGFGHVVLSLGFMSERIVAHFDNSFAGIELTYEIEKTLLGTGGAVHQALTQCNEDHVFVFNGDTFLGLETEEVEAYWQSHREPIIVAREVSDTSRYGRLKTSNQRVVDFIEKGMAGPGLINAGCYVFPTGIFDGVTLGQRFSLEKDYLTKVVREQRFDLFISKGQFIDIGMPEDYARAQTELAEICL